MSWCNEPSSTETHTTADGDGVLEVDLRGAERLVVFAVTKTAEAVDDGRRSYTRSVYGHGRLPLGTGDECPLFLAGPVILRPVENTVAVDVKRVYSDLGSQTFSLQS